MGAEGICADKCVYVVCVCVHVRTCVCGVKGESVPATQFSAKAHTWPQDSVGKFFACFLNEPRPP